MKNKLLVCFGQKVRQERLLKKYTQEELANLAGVHRTYIGMIERGEKNITLENIAKIAKALNSSISKMLEDVGNE